MDPRLAGKRLAALTGAGISAESGVPTFRGDGAMGLYKGYRAEQLATPEMWKRDQELVLEWYAWRRSIIARCKPNAAHLALQRHKIPVVTQNVDGLHGPDAVELHGNIWRIRPSGRPDVVWFGEPLDPQVWGRAVEVIRGCEVLLVIGTSGVVQPAASLAQLAPSVITVNEKAATVIPALLA